MVKHQNIMVTKSVAELLHKLKHKKEFSSINETIQFLLKKK